MHSKETARTLGHPRAEGHVVVTKFASISVKAGLLLPIPVKVSIILVCLFVAKTFMMRIKFKDKIYKLIQMFVCFQLKAAIYLLNTSKGHNTHQRIVIDLRIKVDHRRVQSNYIIFADVVRLFVVQVKKEIALGHSHIQGRAGQSHRLFNDTV